MDRNSYPRPVCSVCGMPMTLRTDSKKWFCETCKEFTIPQAPVKIEPQPRDPAKFRTRWVVLAIVLLILFVLQYIRMFVI